MLQDDNTSTNALLGNRGGQRGGESRTTTKSVVSAPPAPPAVNNQVIQTKQIRQSTITEKRKSRKKDDTQFTTVLKFFNIIIGLCVVGFGVACYKFFNEETQNLEFVGIILPGYIAFSGLLILLIQCNLGIIIRNMKFLYSFIGRGLFNIYVGVMPLSLIRTNATPPQNNMFQVIIFIMVSLMCLIGILYIVAKIFCCAKEDNKKKRRRRQDDSDSDD